MSKIVVIGAGRWGENHIRTLKEMGCLGGVVEQRDERRAEICHKYQTPVSKDLIPADGYVVATPAETHAQIAHELVSRGYPTLVEKPCTLSYEDSFRLCTKSMEMQTPLMTGHLLLFHPIVALMENLIPRIGIPRRVEAERIGGIVRHRESVMQSLGCHDISVIDYLLGWGDVQVKSAKGIDRIDAVLESSKLEVRLAAQWGTPSRSRKFRIYGTEGMMSWDGITDTLTVQTSDQTLFFQESGNSLKAELDHFISLIPNRTDKKALTSILETANILHMIEEVRK